MTNTSFQVSVVIPVYNAEKYIERAILSALKQDEVKEVVLVDDGYEDGAFTICEKLATEDSKIKLLTHPNHANKGAGASRNLGIINTNYDYIAFLDADDYFLPNRFALTKETFASDPNIDAVYEPVGYQFDTELARERVERIKKTLYESSDVFTDILAYPKTPHLGSDLFKSMVIGGNDGPCTDGITLKKSLIAQVGLFNTHLRLHQDTEYWFRLIYSGYFAPTSNHKKPVSIRTMHDENRTYAQNINSKFKLWQAILSWATLVDMDKNLFAMVLERYQAHIAK